MAAPKEVDTVVVLLFLESCEILIEDSALLIADAYVFTIRLSYLVLRKLMYQLSILAPYSSRRQNACLHS